jgi:ubiquinone/menaquinone biosynthesis C-methylase UbiE
MKQATPGPLRYDAAEAARVALLYRSPQIAEQRRVVLDLLSLRGGERVLDIGCGPGFLLCDLAAEVAPRGRAVGVDTSRDMLAIAADEWCAAAAASMIDLVHGEGGALPFGDEAFDAAVATQVYEWIHDVGSGLAELRRVLRPGGRAVILDTDWDSVVWHAIDAARGSRILKRWRARVAHPHLPRVLIRLAADAGLRVDEVTVVPLLETTGDSGGYSLLQAEHMAHAIANGNVLAGDEAEDWLADLRSLAGSGEYFFSLNRYAFSLRR